MTKARDIADFKFEDIVDTGTEGTKVASGTTAQRGTTQGQLRFNTETGLAEYYTGTAFKTIDTPPTITSLDVTEVDSQAGGNQTIVITGGNFSSGATVTFIGNSGTNITPSTITLDSETQITTVTPKSSFLNAQEPYGVKVENPSGLSNTLPSQINVDSSPTWNTASGNLGEVTEGDTANFTVSATDVDGDTVSYSETTSVLSGAGFSLNSSTGAITGTASDVSADTTNTFTLRATANTKTADRIFNIIVRNTASGGSFINTYTYNSINYKIHKFTSTDNFISPSALTVDYLIIGGGGSGGRHSGAGGGAGGLVWLTGQTLTASTYTATIGTGGTALSPVDGTGNNGGNSSFNSHIALGGGGGGYYPTGGQNGGCGGGSSRELNSAGQSIQFSTYGYGQGFDGASTGANGVSPNYAGYAGGGTGQAGQIRIGGNGSSTFVNSSSAETTALLLASVAGTDSSNNATTSSSSGTLYIGGGGGGSDQDFTDTANFEGGLGGGGQGSDSNTTVGSVITNTGSGGGGASSGLDSGAGADGIIIIRYQV